MQLIEFYLGSSDILMLNLKCVSACLCACTNYTIGCPVRNSEIMLKKKKILGKYDTKIGRAREEGRGLL